MAIITREKIIGLIDKKIPGKDYMLIDVRRKEELEYGVIPTSIHIPLDELEEALSRAKKDPDFFKKSFGLDLGKKAKIIFYCRSGNRSAIAESIGEHLGFDSYNYSGSILDWSTYDKNVKAY